MPRDFQGIMVSSTFKDLKEHRQALIDVIGREGFKAIAMENDAAKDEDLIDSSLQMVEDCAIYVGVIGFKYGQVPLCAKKNPQGVSITELEFDRAIALGRPILLFLMDRTHPLTVDDVEPDPAKKAKLDAFRDRAKLKGADSELHRVYAAFKSVSDFRDQAWQSIGALKTKLVTNAPAAPAAPGLKRIPAPPALYAPVPYIPSQQKFIGRQAELDAITDWCAAANPNPVFLFEAIGGSGKSYLTWHWIHQHAQRARTDWAGIFWYSFYERGATMADFCRHALAYLQRRPLEEFAKKKTAEMTGDVITELRARPWLLVLDGLERVLVAYHRYDAAQLPDDEADTAKDQIAERDPTRCIQPEDDDLLRLLAGAEGSKVLISSRLIPKVLTNASRQGIGGVLLDRLKGLRPADAEELFRASGVRGDGAAMREYLQAHCDCHPLTVGVLAGLVGPGYLKDPGNFDAWRLDPAGGGRLDFAQLDLVQRRNDILQFAVGSLAPKTRDLLCVLALLSEAADYETLAALNPQEGPEAERKLGESIRDLQARGLVQFEAAAKAYDLHPVVRSAALRKSTQVDHGALCERVDDHFSALSHNPYEKASTVEDVRVGVQIVRVRLQAGRLEEAADAYMGDLSRALLLNLEAHSLALSLLRPFFPRGWDVLPEGLAPWQQSYLATDVGHCLRDLGERRLSLAAYGAALAANLAGRAWSNLGAGLANIGNVSGLAKERVCRELAVRLASATGDADSLFVARLDLFFLLAKLGEKAEAEEQWRLVAALRRPANRARYRPGYAEAAYAWFRYYAGELQADELADAERAATDGHNRLSLREVHRLRGQWLAEQGNWAGAAASSAEAVRMARAVGRYDAHAEAWLALAEFHASPQADHRARAEELASAKSVAHRPLAEVWLALGDRDRAVTHALAAYENAWDDGEPYVYRFYLNKAKELLGRLGEPIPNLPPYDPAKAEKFPWQDAVEQAIAELEAEKAAKEKKQQ